MDAIFGGLERFGAEVIYPNRWLFLALALVAVAAALALAWRFRLHRPLWRRRYLTAAVAIPLLAVALPVGWYLLSPLWERSFLEEAAPEFERPAAVAAATATVAATPTATPPPDAATAAAATASPRPTATPTPTPAAEEPAARLVAMGEWRGADDFHFARGQAYIVETAPGAYILRVENFSVRNGPDLFVYLSRDPDGWEDEAVNLGDLKATDGAFNYDIPPELDVSEFRSAVVWCRRFAVLFGHATLTVP